MLHALLQLPSQRNLDPWNNDVMLKALPNCHGSEDQILGTMTSTWRENWIDLTPDWLFDLSEYLSDCLIWERRYLHDWPIGPLRWTLNPKTYPHDWLGPLRWSRKKWSGSILQLLQLTFSRESRSSTSHHVCTLCILAVWVNEYFDTRF